MTTPTPTSPSCRPASRRCAGQIVLTVAFILCLVVGAGAGNGPVLTVDGDRQFELAQSFFRTGDFAAAAVEYRRFTHFFPEDSRVEASLYRIGQCHFKAEDYGRAIEAFYEVIDRFPDGQRAADAYRAIAACHLKQDASGQAVAVLQRLIDVSRDPSVTDDTNYRIGWIYLDAGDWKRAHDYFSRVSPGSGVARSARHLSQELQKGPAIPRKDPQTAGLLAVLPGAGHLYSGRYRDALISFALNAALIAAAIEAFDNDLPMLGGVITAVEAGFYVGNIYSAVGSAHKYNRAQERAYIEDLKKSVGPQLSLGISMDGVAALIRIPF